MGVLLLSFQVINQCCWGNIKDERSEDVGSTERKARKCIGASCGVVPEESGTEPVFSMIEINIWNYILSISSSAIEFLRDLVLLISAFNLSLSLFNMFINCRASSSLMALINSS